MFTDKLFILALAAISLLLPACDSRTTESETTEVTYTLEKQEPSAMFWDYAASTSMLQTELSKLAKQKSEDTQVLALADSALLQHTKALRKLQRISGKYEYVQLPDSLTGADKTIVKDFKALEGEEFETRYLEYLENSISAQLNRYQETLNETEDPALRSWLNNMKAHLRSQLQLYAAADTLEF
ncbi:DUF4142 domain-containing protein [Pontibacter sp. KCTC 32443]|uniref:DUF4142 domain-containing protein n=1 Tax=Pontibacter TaxID=323449 RepID=UPI00164E8C7A|nr:MULTISPECIES: DUF4142 domain-containing protein [Pontibacter]MBC5774251.1 DUF4142 domain-containing protein [Pontibacter sp. KCTC 32443]